MIYFTSEVYKEIRDKNTRWKLKIRQATDEVRKCLTTMETQINRLKEGIRELNRCEWAKFEQIRFKSDDFSNKRDILLEFRLAKKVRSIRIDQKKLIKTLGQDQIQQQAIAWVVETKIRSAFLPEETLYTKIGLQNIIRKRNLCKKMINCRYHYLTNMKRIKKKTLQERYKWQEES